MRNKLKKSARRTMALVLLCLLFSSLGGCANSENTREIYYNRGAYTAYPDVIGRMLPAYTLLQKENMVYPYLENGATSEAFDAHALPALEHGIAAYWYPHYLASVVIAIDRDRTDARINGWRDLLTAGEDVGISDAYIDRHMLISAIAYGLEGTYFTLESAISLLGTLKNSGHLIVNSFEPPIVICYDHQAAAMLQSGRNIQTIVPSEGTLTYERGLLSNQALTFTGDVHASLLLEGFRLPDGRCDSALYPDAAAYMHAARLVDYTHFNRVCQDTTRMLRRRVYHVRLYSSADAREHQFFALVYIALVVAWMVSIINRAMQKGVRRAALFTGMMLLGWIIVRLIKYQTGEADTLNRYLWYGFYPFQLALPLLLLFLALLIDKPDGCPVQHARLLRALAAIDACLVLLVFTNDLHGLVFRLDLSSLEWRSDYSYGIGYYVILAACVLPILAALCLLLYKSGRNPRKKGFLFPLGFVVLLFLYGYGYITRIPFAWESDFTMMMGLFTMLFFEAAMRTGLMPVNTKYAMLFAHSSLKMQIVDEAGTTLLASRHAAHYGDSLSRALSAYPSPVQTDENTRVYATKISGGYGIWQEDIAVLHQLHTEVETSVRKLTAANAVLKEETQLKRAIGEEIAKTQLMTQLEGEIAGLVARLTAMIEGCRFVFDPQREAARIAVLLCYVKRRCNLFFRERETDALPANELCAYMDELAEIASYADVQCIVTCALHAPLSVRRATLLYDFFYQAMDWAAAEGCPTMLAHVSDENGSVTLRLLPSSDASTFAPGPALSTAIASARGEFAQKDLDGAIGIRLTFSKGGENDG